MEKLHRLISNMFTITTLSLILRLIIKEEHPMVSLAFYLLNFRTEEKKFFNRNTYTIYMPQLFVQDGLKCATNNLAKYDVRQRFLSLVILVLLVCIV